MTTDSPDPLRYWTHGEVLAVAEEAGFRFHVWSVPAADDPTGTAEGVTIEEPDYGAHREVKIRLLRSVHHRMFAAGLREFVILRELARRPVSTAGYDASEGGR